MCAVVVLIVLYLAALLEEAVELNLNVAVLVFKLVGKAAAR